MGALRRSDSQLQISSTLPVLRNVKISESQRKKDDEIFGADLADDMPNPTPAPTKKEEWFINDNGYVDSISMWRLNYRLQPDDPNTACVRSSHSLVANKS